jgi:hypothetical protein
MGKYRPKLATIMKPAAAGSPIPDKSLAEPVTALTGTAPRIL